MGKGRRNAVRRAYVQKKKAFPPDGGSGQPGMLSPAFGHITSFGSIQAPHVKSKLCSNAPRGFSFFIEEGPAP